jgi:hypothetical protein
VEEVVHTNAASKTSIRANSPLRARSMVNEIEMLLRQISCTVVCLL